MADNNAYSPLPNERIVWQAQQKAGIIHRKVVTQYILTNMRAIANDATAFIKDLDNIVVLNSTTVRRYNRYGYRGYGGGTASSSTIGDIVFMSKGVARVIFRQVNDPRGVLQLAKSVKNASSPRVTNVRPQTRITTSSPNLVNVNPDKSQINKGQIMRSQGISQPQSRCPKCQSQSPFGSNYCTKCGFMLK
jgi:hypothetical protein